MMEVFKYSAKGSRHTNEDFLLVRQLPYGCTLCLLADGMGGYQHGELASSLACITIEHHLLLHLEKENIPASIELAIKAANDAIGQQRKALGDKLGSTIAGFLVEINRAFFFWLGDVRIYHFRNKKTLFQSEDHSLVNDMKKQGVVSVMDIIRYGNIVTRSLMGDAFQDKIPVIETRILPGDILMLCSDGLWHNWDVDFLSQLREEELKQILEQNKFCNNDNYSIIKIHVEPVKNEPVDKFIVLL